MKKTDPKGEEYAILVCSAMNGLMPETTEQLKICKEKGIKKEVVLEALKEATRLKKFLEECIYDYDMVVYYPSWCTGYEDKKTSLKMVKNAIRELKVMIKGLYTEHTLTQEKWRELVGIGK